LWIQHELSYDRFHERSNQLYRIIENQYYANNELFPVAVTPAPFGPYLKENTSEIENTTRTSEARFLFQHGDLKFNELGYMVDPSFFEMFSLDIVRGDQKTLLSNLDCYRRSSIRSYCVANNVVSVHQGCCSEPG
jgi:putative ABC transport system permease protein